MAKKPTTVDAVIEALGGPSNAARALHTTPSVVMNWRTRKQVPAKRVLEIETATGIPRHVLRPDIFGAAELVAHDATSSFISSKSFGMTVRSKSAVRSTL